MLRDIVILSDLSKQIICAILASRVAGDENIPIHSNI